MTTTMLLADETKKTGPKTRTCACACATASDAAAVPIPTKHQNDDDDDDEDRATTRCTSCRPRRRPPRRQQRRCCQLLIEIPPNRNDAVQEQQRRRTTVAMEVTVPPPPSSSKLQLYRHALLRAVLLSRHVDEGDDDTDGIDVRMKRIPRRKRDALFRSAYLAYRGVPLTVSTLHALLVQQDDEEHDSIPCRYLQLKYRVLGGMVDRQNRVGSKFGGGGVSSSQQTERERKERLKKLALESIDLAKDPYLVKSHLGTYECKLCLTLHRDEANYLAHTQGKKHQQGLARRAHLDQLRAEKEGKSVPQITTDTTAGSAGAGFGGRRVGVAGLVGAGHGISASASSSRRVIKIGRPAYQVFKSRDPETNQRCLSFEISYPEISEDIQPRHRFMSAFEQRVETVAPASMTQGRQYQYLLFAAEPYETIAFKIPNDPIDKGQDRFVTHWDSDANKFFLSLYFLDPPPSQRKAPPQPSTGKGRPDET